MPRKPSETVQVNLRIKETLRRRLAKVAELNGCSLNYELVERLSRSLDTVPPARPFEDIVGDMKVVWAKYGQAFHAVAQQGSLISVLDTLIGQTESLLPFADEARRKDVEQTLNQARDTAVTAKWEAAQALTKINNL
jgi:hypothetical protein